MTPQNLQKIEKIAAAVVLSGVVAGLHAAGKTDLAQQVTVLGAALLAALGLGSVNTAGTVPGAVPGVAQAVISAVMSEKASEAKK